MQPIGHSSHQVEVQNQRFPKLFFKTLLRFTSETYILIFCLLCLEEDTDENIYVELRWNVLTLMDDAINPMKRVK